MGIGIDIEEVNRFRDKKPIFYKKIFTDNEILYAKTYKNYAERYAGFFCAKEAFIKAFGCEQKINVKEIEVLHLKCGKPYLNFHGEIKKMLIQKYKNEFMESKLADENFMLKNISYKKNCVEYFENCFSESCFIENNNENKKSLNNFINQKINLSISHTRNLATAIVIIK